VRRRPHRLPGLPRPLPSPPRAALTAHPHADASAHLPFLKPPLHRAPTAINGRRPLHPPPPPRHLPFLSSGL
jgi:hypothetical protein